ncbi:hypothetical protein [Pseudogemmobacter humi]|uniref:Uncharacterized protein n=1 Tax=Pseudogemmobacter humi TaxID=2483812 RepID=A0A3P5X770_9RHOB|nr:hypothetical protein [Pseudogemmobacter humi]VDC30233.1 hypothetical protein XINFAN_02493 [Pseudogemmobacter humi]
MIFNGYDPALAALLAGEERALASEKSGPPRRTSFVILAIYALVAALLSLIVLLAVPGP